MGRTRVAGSVHVNVRLLLSPKTAHLLPVKVVGISGMHAASNSCIVHRSPARPRRVPFRRKLILIWPRSEASDLLLCQAFDTSSNPRNQDPSAGVLRPPQVCLLSIISRPALVQLKQESDCSGARRLTASSINSRSSDLSGSDRIIVAVWPASRFQVPCAQ